MEDILVVVVVGICVILWEFVRDNWDSLKIVRLKAEIEEQHNEILSLKNRTASAKGNEAKAMKRQRMEEALGVLVEKAKAEPNKDKLELIKEVGLAYPDVAMELLRKGL